jgi:hypothetical protein
VADDIGAPYRMRSASKKRQHALADEVDTRPERSCLRCPDLDAIDSRTPRLDR